MAGLVARKSKSALFLIELIIAILFFALSSAICVQLFAKAHLISQKSRDMTMAVFQAQTAAEEYRAGLQGAAERYYSADWSALQGPEGAVYRLVLAPEAPGEAGLARTAVEVWRVDDAEPLYTLQTGRYAR